MRLLWSRCAPVRRVPPDQVAGRWPPAGGPGGLHPRVEGRVLDGGRRTGRRRRRPARPGRRAAPADNFTNW